MKTDAGTKKVTVKLVSFRLGSDLFAADVASVDRVLRYETPSSVPDVPAWVAGVIEHRGKVIPVVDLRRRMELPNDAVTSETRIMVFSTADGWIGAIVDGVLEVVPVPVDAVTPPPALFRGLDAKSIRGIAKVNGQLVVVLDVDRVLGSADRIVVERAIHITEAATRG